MKCESIKAWLYNNPLLEGTTMETVYGYKWEMKNIPHIDILGEGIHNGKNRVEIAIFSTDGKEVYANEKEVKIDNHKFSVEFELHKPLLNPEIIKIKVKNKYKETFHEEKCKLHRIHGKVTDFNNEPISAYVWAIPARELYNVVKNGFDGTVVRADQNGRYELWLPEEKITGIFIDDESYHKNTFECWIWDVDLRRDIIVNPHIDKAEIYNLHVWQSYLDYPSLHLHFIPTTLLRTLNKQPDKLKKSDIKVWINNKQCEIKTFTEHATWYGKGGQPSYILDVESSEFDPQNTVIKVEVQIKTRFKGKTVIEKGEAYFLGFYQ